MVKKLITEAGFYGGTFRSAGQMYDDGKDGDDDAPAHLNAPESGDANLLASAAGRDAGEVNADLETASSAGSVVEEPPSTADKKAAAKKLAAAEKAVTAAQAKVDAAGDDAAKMAAIEELTAAQAVLADLKA